MGVDCQYSITKIYNMLIIILLQKWREFRTIFQFQKISQRIEFNEKMEFLDVPLIDLDNQM